MTSEEFSKAMEAAMALMRDLPVRRVSSAELTMWLYGAPERPGNHESRLDRATYSWGKRHEAIQHALTTSWEHLEARVMAHALQEYTWRAQVRVAVRKAMGLPNLPTFTKGAPHVAIFP